MRTLDESGRLVQLQYQGDHLQFTDEFWAKVGNKEDAVSLE